jgi:hypothetical protein
MAALDAIRLAPLAKLRVRVIAVKAIVLDVMFLM